MNLSELTLSLKSCATLDEEYMWTEDYLSPATAAARQFWKLVREASINPSDADLTEIGRRLMELREHHVAREAAAKLERIKEAA